MIASGPKDAPAVVCGIMRRDRERADSILEGAETGVVISSIDDPKTFWGFCCGADDPPDDVGAAYARAEANEAPLPCSYHCCPVYRAGLEVDAAERLFGAYERPPTEAEYREMAAELGIEVDVPDDRRPSVDELKELFGFEKEAA